MSKALALIDQEKAHHAVSRLCRVLGVPRAAYYAWKRPVPSQRARQDAALTERIRAAHKASKGTYGAPRIHAELRLAGGIRVGRKRVARLLRAAGLQGCHRRRRTWTTRRDPKARPAPDLVGCQFTAEEPDRLWHRHQAGRHRPGAAVCGGAHRRLLAGVCGLGHGRAHAH